MPSSDLIAQDVTPGHFWPVVRAWNANGSSRLALAVIFDGAAFPSGVCEPRPIINLPPGAKLRLRMRNDAELIAYVRTDSGISAWTLECHGDNWKLCAEVGRNYTLPTQS